MKNKKAQFQGSKSNARKQAFLARVEKRKQNRMLPVLVGGSPGSAIAPYSMMRVPVLNALINPVNPAMPDVVYKDEDRIPRLLLGA